MENSIDSSCGKTLSRRQFLKLMGAGAGALLGLDAAAIETDNRLFGGAIQRSLQEQMVPAEILRQPRLIEPVIFCEDNQPNFDPKLAQRRVEAVMQGIQALYRNQGAFHFNLSPTQILALHRPENLISKLPNNWDTHFRAAARGLIREHGLHQPGGTFATFCAVWQESESRLLQGLPGHRFPDAKSEVNGNHFMVYSWELHDLLDKEANLATLLDFARLTAHEIGHTFGLGHVRNSAHRESIMGIGTTARYAYPNGPSYPFLRRLIDDRHIEAFVANLDISFLPSEKAHLATLYK